MQTKLIWEGIEYNSIETCFVESNEQGVKIYSTVAGSFNGKRYNLKYEIKTNQSWETLSVCIDFKSEGGHEKFTYESDTKGNWTCEGKSLDAFKGCIDVDIPLTPLTNTLPIKRLRMEDHSPENIKVLYFDLLAHETKAVHQLYERKSVLTYHYENIPNDFEGEIEVDENGFVIYYPSLFLRKKEEVTDVETTIDGN